VFARSADRSAADGAGVAVSLWGHHVASSMVEDFDRTRRVTLVNPVGTAKIMSDDSGMTLARFLDSTASVALALTAPARSVLGWRVSSLANGKHRD